MYSGQSACLARSPNWRESNHCENNKQSYSLLREKSDAADDNMIADTCTGADREDDADADADADDDAGPDDSDGDTRR